MGRSVDSGPSWDSWTGVEVFENLSIRSKIVAIIAAPVIALMVMSGIGAFQRRQTASDSRSDERLIAVTQSDIAVASALGVESVLSATPGAGAQLIAARTGTDKAVAALQPALQDLLSHADADTQAAVVSIQSRLATIVTIRQALDQSGPSPDLINGTYPGAINELLGLPTRLLGQVHNPQTVSQLQTILALYRYQASVADASTRLAPVVAAGSFADAKAADAFQRAVDQQTTDQAVFNTSASPQATALLRSAQSGPAVDLVDQVQTDARSGQQIASGTSVQAWSSAVQQKLLRIDAAGQKLAAQLRADANARAADASQSANLFILAALLALVVALALTILLARAITRPLGKLTRAAHELSDEQLPKLVDGLRNPAAQDLSFLRGSVEKLDVASRDEIGQLADAFNAVQQVAVDVATEQAELLRKGIGDMFVNLARRNQSLLDRQIEFIDDLENAEEDPDALQQLFHLDHLATRMRRNAESLLVLAGAEPNRRRGRPVALTDVVRAALGEVEDFARIDLLDLEEVLITNNAAADIAHLLSELMENATNFSPPDTRVEVVGHRTNSEGYVLSVTDSGIGMSPQQMDEANETLANPPLVGLAMSRSLGFIVIGRLAARFGISVRLMASSGGGVTAVVAMPAVIVHEMPGDTPAAAPVESPTVDLAEPWTPQVVGPESELLPPLEFTPFGGDDVPESFDDAVPGGRAFEEGVAELAGAPGEEPGSGASERGPVLPTLHESSGPEAAPSVPAEPAPSRPRLFGPVTEAGDAEPTQAGPNQAEPAQAGPSDPGPSHGEPAPATADAGPEPLPGSPAPSPSPIAGSRPPSRLFGTPSPVEAPASPNGTATDGTATNGASSNGDGAVGGEAPGSPTLPEPLPEPLLEPVAEPVAEAPAPPDPHGEPTEPAPVSNRLFGAVRSAPDGEATAATPPARSGDGLPSRSGGSLPTRGAAGAEGGLTRRTPRRTATRPKPGGEGPARQGVVATKRSPDEVRSLLSNYRSAAKKGSSANRPDPADPSTEGDR